MGAQILTDEAGAAAMAVAAVRPGGTSLAASSAPEVDPPAAQVANAPDDAAIVEVLRAAQADLDAERFDAARERLVAARARSPDDPRLAVVLADVLWRAGELAEAGELDRRVRALLPKSGRALLGLTRYRLACGATDEALALSAEGIAIAPEEPEPWLLRSATLIKAGRYPEAYQAREKALDFLARDRAAGRDAPGRLRPVLDVVRAVGVYEPQIRRHEMIARLDYELRAGVPVAPIVVAGADGREVTVPMVVDTGGTFMAGLDTSLAAELGVATEPGTSVGGMNRDSFATASAILPRLELGGWSVRGVAALFYPVPSDPTLHARANPPYRGVLGTALLQRRMVIFHPQQGFLRLLSGRNGRAALQHETMEKATRVPFFLVGDGKVVARVELGDDHVLALIDSGSANSVISARCAERHAPARIAKTAPAADGSDVAAPPPAPLALACGGLATPLASVAVQSSLDRRVSPQLGTEISLLLGMDFLARFDRFVVDYVHQELLLLLPDASK